MQNSRILRRTLLAITALEQFDRPEIISKAVMVENGGIL